MECEFPSNTYRKRGLKVPIYIDNTEVGNNEGYHYVRIKCTVWPDIYGEQRAILFPTVEAALRFAQNNLTLTRPVIRVFTPSGESVATFEYKNIRKE